MHRKDTTDLIPIACKNLPFSYFIASAFTSAFTKCHFWNHCQLAFCICHHSAPFNPWSDIFGTTKVSDKSSETSAFQTFIPHKMIWTFGTMSVCVTMKSEIGHWIYKQAKHSCWKWSIKPYAWLTVRRTVLSLIILNLCVSGTSITAFVGVPIILDINETKQLNIVQTSLNNIKLNHKHRKHPRQHSPEHSNYKTKASYWF